MLITDRLALRPFTLDDLPFLMTLHSDPDVARYLGDGAVKDESENRGWLARTLDAGERGLGQYLVTRTSDGQPIGRTGGTPVWLVPGRRLEVVFDRHLAGPDALAAVELGYTFLRSAWGHGYATEAARAMCEHLAHDRGLDVLVSVIHVDNTPSFAVSERLGFTRWQAGECVGRPAWVMRRVRTQVRDDLDVHVTA